MDANHCFFRILTTTFQQPTLFLLKQLVEFDIAPKNSEHFGCTRLRNEKLHVAFNNASR